MEGLILITPDQLREIISSELAKQLSQMPIQQKKDEAESEYLTVKEVGKLLSVSRVTLNTWGKNGKLKPVSMGRNLRYRKSDVNNLMKNK